MMNNNRIIDFSNAINEDNERIKRIVIKTKEQNKENNNTSNEINNLINQTKQIYERLGIQFPKEFNVEKHSFRNLDWDDKYFILSNYEKLDIKISKQINNNPELLPKLNSFDWTIVGIAGLVAAILDFLVVRIPKDMNYLRQFNQKGSDFTIWLKSIGIDENGKLNGFLKWCEDTCKVSYDTSNIKEYGIYPRNHRLRSLGHDPLFGLIFGIFDILNGSLTVFDKDGVLHVLKTVPTNFKDIIFAPLIWIGHLISDVCTSQGLPIPGWVFLQLAKIGTFGSKDRTISQISEWMYLNGYDLRHFVTMSIVPATIEIIIRGYALLMQIENEQTLSNPLVNIADKELNNIKAQLKLHKMLFLAHSFATGGNALKVWTYQGNPTAINASEWMVLIKESLEMITAITRDKTTEKVMRNREDINKTWEEIEDIKI